MRENTCKKSYKIYKILKQLYVFFKFIKEYYCKKLVGGEGHQLCVYVTSLVRVVRDDQMWEISVIPGQNRRKGRYLIFLIETDHIYIPQFATVSPSLHLSSGHIIISTPFSLKSAPAQMINCIVTLLINKLIEHMVMFTVLESQANLTKPPVFVLDLGTDAVWCQRYHCLVGIRKSMLNNGYKVTEGHQRP